MFEYAPCEEKLIQVSKAIGGVYEMNAVATRSIARDLAANGTPIDELTVAALTAMIENCAGPKWIDFQAEFKPCNHTWVSTHCPPDHIGGEMCTGCNETRTT